MNSYAIESNVPLIIYIMRGLLQLKTWTKIYRKGSACSYIINDILYGLNVTYIDKRLKDQYFKDK